MAKFKQPSVMSAQKRFSQVPAADIPRSKFDRSHSCKTTFDAGLLIPIFVDEVLPGDTFHMKSTALARFATPLHPIMDNVFIDTHYFYVPNRLVWDNWAEFMGERKSPNDDPNDFTMPQAVGTVEDSKDNTMNVAKYFGLPRLAQSTFVGLSVNALPFRAYNLIWNEWYRDQNLQNPVPVNTTSTEDDLLSFNLLPRGKRKDYFTGALPWPQKGDPVMVPLGEDAPLYWPQGGGTPFEFNMPPDGPNVTTVLYNDTGGSASGGDLSFEAGSSIPDNNDNYVRMRNNMGFADLGAATGVSINDLRTAFQIQKLLERDARGGTRYIELIQSHFGVTSDDARLQRPEFLGGGTTRLNVHPTPSMVATEDAPQGNLAAFGTAVGDARFTKSFTEHGIIIGLVSVRADLNYQRGVERFWSRRTRYDFYWPALAHLGEQAILNKEINFRDLNDPNGDDAVFGYQERYAEYRYKPSRITGLFNSDCANPIDQWHLAQDFPVNQQVSLNSSFIEERPPIDRVIAVPSEPAFICDIWFDLKCDRPMPVYSVPGLIDHF